MTIIKQSLLVTMLFLFFMGCVPKDFGKKISNEVTLDFKDKGVQKIIDLQERQVVDSLILYLNDENPTYRYLAARALGAMKKDKAIEPLVNRLKDEYMDVKIASAYALGQIGKSEAEMPLLNAFIRQDTLRQFAAFNAVVMEAVGKCGTAKRLQDLCTINTFQISDTLLLLGQAYGIYRFGMRDTFDLTSIRKMVSFVSDKQMPEGVRLVASSYLGRLKTQYDTTVTHPLSRIVASENNPDIRMGLAKALAKGYGGQFVVPNIDMLYRRENDYRVKITLLESLNNYDYALTQPTAQLGLRDKNPQVAATAARYFVKYGSEKDAVYYQLMAKDETLPVPVRQQMLTAAVKWSRLSPKVRDSLNNALIQAYKSAQNPYEKAQLLRGVAEYGWNYTFIREEALNPATPPIVRTAAADGLKAITVSPTFFQTFKGYSSGIKKQLKGYLLEIIQIGDAGAVTVAAEALRAPEAQYNKKLMRDMIVPMSQALQKFKLPNDMEAYESLRETMNYILDSAAFAKPKLDYPRSVDWSIAAQLSANPKATVKTSKGTITFDLLMHNAPISVVNFVSLARSGFFNGKAFHRVVPNYVIQTGCPRGDGYGSLDFTISSELPLVHYDAAGYVGMASAGNHTECSQWFVTRSTALHLDPNYTIFGRVTEGLDVANTIEVGDVVESVTIN